MAGNQDLQIARMIKSLASYDESEIMLSVLKMTGNKIQFKKSTMELIDGVSASSMVIKKRTKVTVASPDNKFLTFITKLKANLRAYEEGEEEGKDITDLFTVDMSCFGHEYSELLKGKNMDAVTALHTELITAGETIQTAQLFIHFELGRFYRYVKESFGLTMTWTATCEVLGIQRTTAGRFIQFASIVDSLPRLLISGLDMKSLMINYKNLKQYITIHTHLKTRLSKNLRNSKFSSQEYTITQNQIVPNPNDVLPEYNAKTQDWTDGYEASDALHDNTQDMELSAPLEEEEQEDEEDEDYNEDLTERFAG
jgi:hypothetical protein